MQWVSGGEKNIDIEDHDSADQQRDMANILEDKDQMELCSSNIKWQKWFGAVREQGGNTDRALD